MGQLVCSDQRKESQDELFGRYSESLLRESRYTTYNQSVSHGSSSHNLCKDLGIGQYLTDQTKVSQLWKEIQGILKIINTQDELMNSEFYIRKKTIQGDSIIETNPFVQQQNQKRKESQITLEGMKSGYYFVLNVEDRDMVQYYMIDKKGMRLLLSLGPPKQFRWSCWKTVVLINTKYGERYEEVLSKAKGNEQIMMDIHRTLVTHPFFQKTSPKGSGFGQQQLMRVLSAITVAFPKLGYCQGMNFLIGFILMVSGCDEQLTYSFFGNLLTQPKYLLYFIFSDTLPMVHFLSFFTNQTLQRLDPELYHYLMKTGVPDSFWVTKMIMTVFLGVCSLDNCLRLWDYFVARGLFGLVELSSSLVSSFRNTILNSDLEQVGLLFQGQQRRVESLSQLTIDIESVIHKARTIFRIKKNMVRGLTTSYIHNIQQNQRRRVLDLEVIFLDFDNPKKFEEKMVQYLTRFEIIF